MDRIHRMSRGRKTLLSLLLVGAVAAVAGIGTFSAFSATTSNTGNYFNAGTVSISDNDSGSAMYTIDPATPGTLVERCIQVTYTGTLAADVSLYASAVGAIGQYVDLTIDKGPATGDAFPDCTNFVSDGNVYSGTLGAFATSHTNFGNGVGSYPGVQTQWNQSDAVVYRFQLTLQNNPAAAGLTSGLHSFTWEAQNQ
jgi:predicted ribosomally synthesized peptide with SipW-like signal peptide